MPVIPEANTTILDDDAKGVHWPATSQRTPVFQPSVVPPGYLYYVTGAFDDIAGSSRGNGPQIGMSRTGAGSVVVEGRMLEHCYILGGEIGQKGGQFDDHISMEVYAPASAPTSTAGVGNTDKVATGSGFNILVPVPGGDGDWTVDGSTMEAGEINQDLCPVRNATVSGYWHWDPDASPSITPVADPGNPDGEYDLFDAELPIVRQANRLPLLASGEVTPDTLKGKKILPHWTYKFTMTVVTNSGAVEAVGVLRMARKKTV